MPRPRRVTVLSNAFACTGLADVFLKGVALRLRVASTLKCSISQIQTFALPSSCECCHLHGTIHQVFWGIHTALCARIS